MKQEPIGKYGKVGTCEHCLRKRKLYAIEGELSKQTHWRCWPCMPPSCKERYA